MIVEADHRKTLLSPNLIEAAAFGKAGEHLTITLNGVMTDNISMNICFDWRVS